MGRGKGFEEEVKSYFLGKLLFFPKITIFACP
jgi:hypothetical protein